LTLLLWALYAAGATAIGAAARFVRRPIPALAFSAFVLLPVLYLLPGFLSDRTAIPVEDVRLTYPWTTLGPPFGSPTPHRNPNLNDIAFQIAPWTAATRAAWKAGSLPWLDRWNGCGMPLAANPQSGAFSPFTLAGLLLPLGRSFTLAEALKLLAALSGAWLWLTELRISRGGAFLGALAFGFSLLMTVWLPWPFASVVALWPWAFFLLERLDDPSGRVRAAALLCAVLLAWAASGHPESAALGASFLAVWAAFRFLSGGWSSPGAILKSAVLAGAIALALSAPILLPQIDAIRASNRRARAESALDIVSSFRHPHRPWWRPGFVVPFAPKAFGDAIEAPMLPQAVYSYPEVSSGYVGAAAWILALLTLRPGSRRRRETLGFVAIGAIAFAVSGRTWPAIEALARVPGLGVMLTVRFQAWIVVCAAALAAFEFDRWRRDVAANPRQALWMTAAAAAFGGVSAALFLRLRPLYVANGGYRAEAASLAIVATVVAAIGAAAAIPAIRGRARLGIVFAVLVVSSIGELFAISLPFDRLGPSGAVFPSTPLVEFLRGLPGTFRVSGVSTALFPSSNVFAGVEDVRTHDPLERRDYVELLDAAAGYPTAEYFKTFRDPGAPLFDLLNVEYAVAPPGASLSAPRWEKVYSGRDGEVFRNRSARARVWAPRTVRSVGGAPAGHFDDAFAAFGIPPAEVVRQIGNGDAALVVSDGRSVLPDREGNAPAISEIERVEGSIAFTADVAGREPSVVVASETQDGGWRAADEDGALATGRADGPFLAVAVRPGRHRVRLEYSPPRLRAGVAVAAAGGALGAVGIVFGRRRERLGERRSRTRAIT